jgi:predicted ATPase
VNFDLKFDRLNLFLGPNGSGKSSVLEVLWSLQWFLRGVNAVDDVFPGSFLTRWQNLSVQQFALEVVVGGRNYLYELTTDLASDGRGRRVTRERLTLAGNPLFLFQDESAHLYDGSSRLVAEYPLDWTKSGVGSLPLLPNNPFMTEFRDEVLRFVIVHPSPPQMRLSSDKESRALTLDCDNFASWYRFLSQEHQGNILDLVNELRGVLPGFDSFSLREAGENVRLLKVLRRMPGDGGKTTLYNFDELSDGERALILLYTLVYGLKGLGYSLFLDEPDNYVSLREIQPWLTALHDACGNGLEQAVLISHHPEVIDYLAGSAGRWFERPDGGPVRVTDKPSFQVDGLTPSEMVARGWES